MEELTPQGEALLAEARRLVEEFLAAPPLGERETMKADELMRWVAALPREVFRRLHEEYRHRTEGDEVTELLSFRRRLEDLRPGLKRHKKDLRRPPERGAAEQGGQT